MARYQCRACQLDEHASWHGELVCPRCGTSTQVRVALAVEEMTPQGLQAMIAGLRNDSVCRPETE